MARRATSRTQSFLPLRGEDRLVALLERGFGRTAPGLRRGIGDDAAVISAPGARELWVVTTDLLLEGIDFRRAWTSPEALGHKALAVNLSDVAAMGARPRFYTVALALPRGVTDRWVGRLYRGMAGLGTRLGAALIGGDLSSARRDIQITVTVLGETVGRRWIGRSGGRPGDLLYVTGVLGASAAGLHLLASGRGAARGRSARAALSAHRLPEPRCEVGLWLARHGMARALLDLSDGLSADLPRLCRASAAGADVELRRLPVFDAARAWGLDPIRMALHGGEDYELLFAVAPERAAELERSYPRRFPPLSRVGRLTPGRGVHALVAPGLSRRPLPPLGFDHFSTPRRGGKRSGATFPAASHLYKMDVKRPK